MSDEVLRERRGHVEILTINRPEARNAINRATALALDAALSDCEGDDDVWVVVLTGAGDKAFSAGMDLKAFAAGEFPITDNGFGGITQRAFPKPIIAAANGAALAGGFEIMISCDMVVAADHAKFGIPEAQRGLIAGGGGLIRLAKRIPLAIAYEMALTADPIDADRAYELGLVNRVVPGDEVLDAAVALAERIAQNAPLAVRVSKDVMRTSLEMTELESWELNNSSFGMIARSADALEGAVAFAEKATIPGSFTVAVIVDGRLTKAPAPPLRTTVLTPRLRLADPLTVPVNATLNACVPETVGVNAHVAM